MIVTLTNTSGGVLNALDVHEGGSGAVGGARAEPLPYPFSSIGALADQDTSVLPMSTADFRVKRVPWVALDPLDEWNQLIQAGKVTLGFAVQAGVRAPDELSKDTI